MAKIVTVRSWQFLESFSYILASKSDETRTRIDLMPGTSSPGVSVYKLVSISLVKPQCYNSNISLCAKFNWQTDTDDSTE